VVQRGSRLWQPARLWLILISGILGTTAALSLGTLQPGSLQQLALGEVAIQDIAAPKAATFESQVLTQAARLAAEATVPEVYDPPDSRIARQQLENLHAATDFITDVRANPLVSSESRQQDLTSLEAIDLSPAAARALLDLPETRWEAVGQEASSVLEEVMRGEIREGRVEEALRRLPAMVSMSLTEEQAALVVDLVSAYIVPNVKYNQRATDLARMRAAQAVPPVTRSFVQGETIVSRGQVVEALQLEALEAFGLLSAANRWQGVAVQALLVALLGTALALYAFRVTPELLRNVGLTAVTSLLFVVAALAMQFAIPDRTVLPYFFPAATLPILLAILVTPGLGLMSALVLGGLAGYLAPRGLELGLYFILTGALAALMIGRAERLSSFIWAGLAADLAGVVVVLVFRLPDPSTDLRGMAELLGGSLASGLISAGLAFGLLLLIGNLLGITTNLQLIELSRPDHPLLQLLLRSAPGSYQHSLQVANLAEQAARAIGANPLLTRVGALYHDVGKALRPQFFIENQIPGHNIHEQLDPATSSSMILNHVLDGIELARKHRLPRAIADFIPEHHGTLETSYQYHAAVKAAVGNGDSVDRADFTYPGPKPRSRETAILMLADGVEAKARSEMPEDEASIDALVHWVIDDRLSKAQLDRTDLTLKDLDTIRRSFVGTLKSIYHPRIRYPGGPPDLEQPVVTESEGQAEQA
jgi:putative nucleotidyltransferase with HDIG domain